MRICERVQTDTDTITKIILVADYNDDGELIGRHEETITEEVPIMETIYRDMTKEEEDEIISMQEYMPEPEYTMEERLQDIEDALCELAMMIGD